MRKRKMGVAIALVFALVSGGVPVPFLDAGMFGTLNVEAATSGTVTTTYGELQWTFEETDGTLTITITGDGTIDADTATKEGGWSAHRRNVKKIVFQNSGSIGQYAFGMPQTGGASPYSNLRTVVIGFSL